MWRALLVWGLVSQSGCAVDADDWEVYLLNSTRIDPAATAVHGDSAWRLPGDPTVGVGLTVELAVTLQTLESNHYAAPDNLRVVADDGSALDIDIGEAQSIYDRPSVPVTLRATAPGPQRIRLVSDSSEEVQSISFEVWESTFDSFVVWHEPDAVRHSAVQARDVSVFAGSNLIVWDRYVAAGSDTPVIGTQPLTAEAVGESTSYEAGVWTLAPRPHAATLTVEGTSETLRAHVVDAEGVSGLHTSMAGGKVTFEEDGTEVTTWHVNQEPVARYDGRRIQAVEGARFKMQAWSLDEADERILGAPIEPYRVTVAGEGFSLLGEDPGATSTELRYQLGVDGPGTATLTIEAHGHRLEMPLEVVEVLP